MRQRPPFFLVPDNISNDTIECLKQLLDHAKRGEVIGLVFGAMLRHRHYIVNSAGEAHRNPTFARGICAAIDDRLSERIRGGNP